MGEELSDSVETRLVKAMESMSGEMFNRRMGLVRVWIIQEENDKFYKFYKFYNNLTLI